MTLPDPHTGPIYTPEDGANWHRAATQWMEKHNALLDLLAEHLPQPECDTCGEIQAVDFDYAVEHCPDPHCDHGRLAWDEHLRRVAANMSCGIIFGEQVGRQS